MQDRFVTKKSIVSGALISLFSGAGGLDLGFENAGFRVGSAYEIRPDAVASYNFNRPERPVAHCADIRALKVSQVLSDLGDPSSILGIVGGSPCQGFSQANEWRSEADARNNLLNRYVKLLGELNQRVPVGFFVLENVVGLTRHPHKRRFVALQQSLSSLGFNVTWGVLDAADFAVPQTRQRIFVVGFNAKIFGDRAWTPPTGSGIRQTVRKAIGHLPEPTYFRRGIAADDISFHPNHWCMVPRSQRFTKPGFLVPGKSFSKSFKTLSWDKPSFTVAYGNREVHVHPNCHRRLSVLEAMLLQSFPETYVLKGSLSSQITQISEAVPPKLALEVASSVRDQLL